jgi:hypothetical protein
VSLATPTTKQMNDTLVAQLEASLSQTIPLFGKAFARCLGRVPTTAEIAGTR